MAEVWRRLAVGWWLVPVLWVLRSEAFSCPTMTACTCQASGSDYEIFCHVDGIQLSIRLLPQRYYTIECETYHPSFDYSKLPRFALGYTTFQTFSFKRCPLPATSLGQVISSLGVTRATAVKFQSSYNLSSSIQRRHLQGLEDLKVARLMLSSNGFTDLPSDLFADMKDLTWLSLLSNNVRLPKGFFETLTKLETLELSDNHLTEIPDDMLSHLSSLKKLYLWHNNIHTLTKPVFKGLTELRDLDLSGNDLTELPEEIFEHLEKLTTISLHANNFTRLPSNIFSDNKNLETVYLFNNNVNLTSLPEHFLSDMEILKDVKLYRIGLEHIPGNAFRNSSQIVNISLAENNIEILPSSLFEDQINMVKLDLSHNRIKMLPQKIFMYQQALEHLELGMNYIESISSDLFDPLIRLKYLSMRQNRLKRIGYDTFTLSNSLVHIDMAHNQLDFLELPQLPMGDSSLGYGEGLGLVSPFQKVVNLKHLDLSYNNITDIYTDWRINHIQLEYLNLSHNKMIQIAYNDMVFLSNQLTVDLRHNNISVVNFRLAEITAKNGPAQPDARQSRSAPAHNVHILIGNNPFACDCILTWFVQYLRDELDPQVRANVDVDIGNATCASSPPGTGLKGRAVNVLRPQDLLCLLDTPSSHFPKMCPDACNCFVRTYDLASILECTGGAVDRIPTIPKVEYLHYTELHLENNGFSKIQRNGDMPENVTKLYLNGNNLTELSLGDIPKDIEVLNLKNNRLTHINASIADMVVNGSRLQELWLSGNPIACDCPNTVFLALVQKHRNKVKDYDELTCPDGKSIKYLPVSNLCGATPVVIGVSVLIALAGLVAGLAAAAYYKYNREIKVYLFARGICLWWVTEEEIDKDKLYDAFVSFSYKDEEFVINKLIAPLEKGTTPFKLCVHFRDWVAGEVIPEQIAKSVRDSRRTIVVLSPNFLDSVWGRMEFRAAHSQALKEGRARVIVVIYGDIGATENLDPELQSYLTTNTYVKWGDPWFWDKLRYALPHPSHRLSRHVSSHSSLTKKKGFDDRLELIHPASPTTPPALNTPPAHQAQTNLLLNHVNGAPNGLSKFPALNGHANGAITMNGLKVNGNAKHSEV